MSARGDRQLEVLERCDAASAAVEAQWEPAFAPWRHGGWYVTNLRYPSGACGCVSRNYPDRKWRIVCGSYNMTFPTRVAAAYAERELAKGAGQCEPSGPPSLRCSFEPGHPGPHEGQR